jgi:hypothetical protein
VGGWAKADSSVPTQRPVLVSVSDAHAITWPVQLMGRYLDKKRCERRPWRIGPAGRARHTLRTFSREKRTELRNCVFRRSLRLAASFAYAPQANPGADATAAYGTSGTGSGFRARASPARRDP